MAQRILWAGDSTVKQNDITTFPQTGIGQVMYLYLKREIELLNFAENGRSTKSFIEEGRLDRILSEIRAGDFLFIQFGHNDQKDDIERHTDPYSDYQGNLTRFITAARQREAYPVLITPLYRRHFDEYGNIKEFVHREYPDAMKQLAAKLEVPVIDLCESSKELYERTGDEVSKKWFMHLKPGEYENYPGGMTDDTHLKYEGAVVMAGLVAKGLERLGGMYQSLLLPSK